MTAFEFVELQLQRPSIHYLRIQSSLFTVSPKDPNLVAVVDDWSLFNFNSYKKLKLYTPIYKLNHLYLEHWFQNILALS